MRLERWQSFSKREQLLFIGSELERARLWQGQDRDKFILALEKALELLDLTIQCHKWKSESYKLWVLRNEISKYYIGENRGPIEILYQAL